MEHQDDRDRRDAGRTIGPLKPADDAIHVDTSAMDAEQVVEHLVQIVQAT